jgi:hypothetical protein
VNASLGEESLPGMFPSFLQITHENWGHMLPIENGSKHIDDDEGFKQQGIG